MQDICYLLLMVGRPGNQILRLENPAVQYFLLMKILDRRHIAVGGQGNQRVMLGV
jgi:hypothetical protein